jgi:thiosulfate reductase cytochrome b subunit
MSNYGKTMKEILMDKFWTMQRRSWLYSIMVALVPLLVAVGLLTGDTAQLVLNVVAAVLAVGGGSMALGNLTPDNVLKLSVQVGDDGA